MKRNLRIGLIIPTILASQFLLAPKVLAADIATDNLGSFVGSIAVAAVGIGGGVALLLIIIGGLMFSLSRGDQEKVQKAKDMITSAIAGLMLIIFATLILKIIGVDIFGLPGMPNFT